MVGKIEVTRILGENNCASLAFTTAVGFNEFENDLGGIPDSYILDLYPATALSDQDALWRGLSLCIMLLLCGL